jgi:trimethylamine--corrinoid protein Co-methyltransferase
VVQQNAEALAGIAFTQMVRKGAPVGYGGFTSNVDMKSGAPAFGTPEYMKAQMLGGQLAPQIPPALSHLQHLRRQSGRRAGGL